VSASSAVRWAKLHELTGSPAAKPRGGVSRSPLAPLTDWLLALDAITKRLFAAHEVKTSTSSVNRFYARHKISFKKSLHASEQQRPDVAEAHENWKMA